MPVVFRHHGIRFHFFSNEGSPLEPVHVHANRSDTEAKIRLLPDVRIADSAGFTARADGTDPGFRTKSERNHKGLA